MTPGEIATYARQQYNSVSDDFFSDAELYKHIWAAQNEMAREGLLIEATYTTSTVADQQEYSYPSLAIALKRVTYDGRKLMPITFREDDVMTLQNQATTSSGTPQYYAIWDKVIYLRPIPAEVGTLKIFSYNRPDEVSALSTLDLPAEFHLDVADFLLWRKSLKDKNFQAAKEYQALWDGKVRRAKAFGRKARRGDGFTYVSDTELLANTVIGAV